jgi:hypothetical protein
MKATFLFASALLFCHPIFAQLPGGRTMAIDPDLFHDTTGTINLHHKKIFDPVTISYWHSDTIIAGNHPISTIDLEPDGTPDSIQIPNTFYTDSTCYNDLWEGHAKSFQLVNDGFVVMGGDPRNIDSSKIYTDAYNSDVGAAIFRANDKIILGSGFRVLHNPDPHSWANDIPLDGSGIPTGGNNNDCSYFHAYTGDRFNDLATCSTKVIRLDFTTTPPSALSPFEKIHPNDLTRDCHCHQDRNFEYEDGYVDTAYVDSVGNHQLRIYAQRKTPCSNSDEYSVQDFVTGGIMTQRFKDYQVYCNAYPDTLGINNFIVNHEFGKYEVEAKMAKGRGAWSAIWSIGGEGGDLLDSTHSPNKNHKYGEIDIIDANIQNFANGYWRHWRKSENLTSGCTDNKYIDDPNPAAYNAADTTNPNSTWIPNKTYFMNCGSIANNIPFIKSHPSRSMYVSYMNSAVSRCDSTGENSFSDCYNKVAYEWLPGEIRFLINDIEVGRTTRYVPSTPLILEITNQIAKYGQSSYNDLSHSYANVGFNELPDSPAIASEILVKRINSDQYDLGIGCKTVASPNTKSMYSSNFSVSLFRVNPNPSDNIANIRFKITGSNDLVLTTLILYDVLGNEIEVLKRKDAVPAGEHMEKLSTEQIVAGTYYIRLEVGNQVKTEKLIILH